MSPSRLPPASAAVALLSTIAAVAAGASSSSCPSNTLSVSYPTPVAASGWSYRLIADGFTKPRGIAFDSDGGLLVIDSGVGLAHLKFNDEGGTCLTVANKTMLVESQEVRLILLLQVYFLLYHLAFDCLALQ
jgi:glucose/arabinose dehydrogenase